MASEPTLAQFVARGYRLGGVVHVGANDGEEYEWYREHGLWPVLLIDPLPEAKQRFHERVGNPDGVRFIVSALGDYMGTIEMVIPEDGDDEKASALTTIPTPGHAWTEIASGRRFTTPIERFDTLAARHAVDVTAYNTLVIDVQGMEMMVIKGFGGLLPNFDFLCIELSAKPVYNGEPPASEVSDALTAQGYHQFSEIKEHDDVLFIKSWLA